MSKPRTKQMKRRDPAERRRAMRNFYRGWRPTRLGKLVTVKTTARRLPPVPYAFQRSGSRLVARAGRSRAAQADAVDPTVSIRVAIAGEQVSTDVAMSLRPRRIVAIRKMPGHRLHTARRIELLPGVNDCPPT